MCEKEIKEFFICEGYAQYKNKNKDIFMKA